MPKLKLTSWNVEWMVKLWEPGDAVAKAARRANIARQIRDIDPDILCLIEGPPDDPADRIGEFCAQDLGGDWVPVRAADGEYATRGKQWIWFLVRQPLAAQASLLPVSTWDDFAGGSWKVNYWSDFTAKSHRHYRHPQVLVVDWLGQRVEFVGLHLKSKFIQHSVSDWNAGGERREAYVLDALKARVKLTTEASNVRNYIDRRFAQTENPAIFVLGDLNDGPGKEFFEQNYLFFDLLSNVQGDVFFARKYLNHALFDFSDDLRWSVEFRDPLTPERDPHILLDHILFTQGLTDGSLPLEVKPHAGLVESEVHELVNANQPAKAETSDHRPVSVEIEV